MKLQVQMLDDGLEPPVRAYDGDAGIDLRARVDVTVSADTGPVTVATGMAVAIPDGHVGLVCPRSGLAAKHGISVLNSPGVIDTGFRGELHVILYAAPGCAKDIRRGDRIAQLIVQAYAPVTVEPVAALPASTRGARGFGSSGA